MQQKQPVRLSRPGRIAACAVFLLLAFFLLNAAGVFAPAVSVASATLTTSENSLSGTGYLFRTETVLRTDREGAVTYEVQSGEKVATATRLGTIYTGASGQEAGEDLQRNLSVIQNQIMVLQEALKGGVNLSELDRTNYRIRQACLDTRFALSEDNLATAQNAKNNLLVHMTRRELMVSQEQTAEQRLESLRAELDRTVKEYSESGVDFYNSTLYGPDGANPGNFSMAGEYTMPDDGIPGEALSFATGSGYFYRAAEVDGFESLFSSSQIASLTPFKLKMLIDSQSGTLSPSKEGDSAAGQVIGKIVSSPLWYVAVPLEADVLTLKDAYGDFAGWQVEVDGRIACVAYPHQIFYLTFDEMASTPVRMELNRVLFSETDGAVMVFETSVMPSGFHYTRAQAVRIRLSDTSGYHVPRKVIQYVDGKPGVYVLDGSVVRFRRITVLYEGDGYVIAEERTAKEARYAQYSEVLRTGGDEAKALSYLHEGDLDFGDFLNLNDQIITYGRNLYDGKILK
ncbi:MAG: hypothetical protein IJU20_05480 [Clostridia bacterium]|nr:hypothetical protein [Clostridia bacterium]